MEEQQVSKLISSFRHPWFLSFRLRTFQFHSQFKPKRRFCLVGSEFQHCNDLHDDKRERSRLGRISYSYESSLLLMISNRYEAVYVLCTNVPFSSLFLWITIESQIVVRIAARILATGFSVAVHRFEGRQQEVRKEFPSIPKNHVLQVSPKPWYLWIPPCTCLPLLRRY